MIYNTSKKINNIVNGFLNFLLLTTQDVLGRIILSINKLHTNKSLARYLLYSMNTRHEDDLCRYT